MSDSPYIDDLMLDQRTKPYPARSGFIVPWQAEILGAWRCARLGMMNAMALSKDSLFHSQEWWREAERVMGERLAEGLYP